MMRRRLAPLRSCGRCARTFRSWREDAVCGRCEEDGSRRTRPVGASAQMTELAGETWEDAFGGSCSVDESAAYVVCGLVPCGCEFGPKVAA